MARECMGESTCMHLLVCEATSASNQWLHEQAGLWLLFFFSKSKSLITYTVLCGLLCMAVQGWKFPGASGKFKRRLPCLDSMVTGPTGTLKILLWLC